MTARHYLEHEANSALNRREFRGRSRCVDRMEVVGTLKSPMWGQLVQNASAEVPAEIGRAWAEFVAVNSSVDKRPERTAARQVEFAVSRELIEVQCAPDLCREVVVTKNSFGRKMTRDDVFQSGIQAEPSLERGTKCSMWYARAEIEKNRKLTC